MPIFDYKCTKCGKIEDFITGQIIEKRNPEICSHCGGKAVRLFPSSFYDLPGKTSTRKSDGWWKKEDTPEATREHTKRCFASLEKQGKLRMPDHTKGGKKIGENKDYKEYADR